MRIGIYDPYLDTLSGGEKYMLSIASCLSSEHEVFIFWDKEKEAEIRQKAYEKLGIDLAKIKFYPNIFRKTIPTVFRLVESMKFDAIIYLSDGSIPLVGAKLFVHFQFPIEWVKGKSLNTRFKLLLVKRIFCNSLFTKHFIDRKLHIKSEVLYPPVNIKTPNDIKKENIILHVGRFDIDRNESNYKKQDVMVRIFKKMVDRGLKGWKFIIVVGVKDGDRNEFNKLQEMTKDYQIQVVENPSIQILWEFYGKAKIYWHATGFGEDLQRYPEKAEHFGISTVEAMGAGAVPVVVNAGGQKEIIEDGKSGFLWKDLEDFITKTDNLIKDKRLLERMSDNAIERSRIFGGDRFCKELKNIIRK